jgi:hypothetical protein
MRETQTDLPLSALSEAGKSLIDVKPPREWDGETIDLSRILASKLAGEPT